MRVVRCDGSDNHFGSSRRWRATCRDYISRNPWVGPTTEPGVKGREESRPDPPKETAIVKSEDKDVEPIGYTEQVEPELMPWVVPNVSVVHVRKRWALFIMHAVITLIVCATVLNYNPASGLVLSFLLIGLLFLVLKTMYFVDIGVSWTSARRISVAEHEQRNAMHRLQPMVFKDPELHIYRRTYHYDKFLVRRSHSNELMVSLALFHELKANKYRYVHYANECESCLDWIRVHSTVNVPGTVRGEVNVNTVSMYVDWVTNQQDIVTCGGRFPAPISVNPF